LALPREGATRAPITIRLLPYFPFYEGECHPRVWMAPRSRCGKPRVPGESGRLHRIVALPREGATRAPITIRLLPYFPFYEGEAPLALPREGATRAPIK
jgi:hypothetical protein